MAMNARAHALAAPASSLMPKIGGSGTPKHAPHVHLERQNGGFPKIGGTVPFLGGPFEGDSIPFGVSKGYPDLGNSQTNDRISWRY